MGESAAGNPWDRGKAQQRHTFTLVDKDLKIHTYTPRDGIWGDKMTMRGLWPRALLWGALRGQEKEGALTFQRNAVLEQKEGRQASGRA